MTWSPGLTLVTPSPTSTTTPAPSWPSTAGNSPSGSSPLSVNASVWQTPVWVIFTSTSPLRGGSTSISTISSGCPAAKATAARDFMDVLRMRGSLEVGTYQRDHLVDARLVLAADLRVDRDLREFLAQVAVEDAGHQPVDRAAQRRDLLQHRPAAGARGDRALQPVHLAADAAQPGDGALLFLGGVRHGHWSAGYWWG